MTSAKDILAYLNHVIDNSRELDSCLRQITGRYELDLKMLKNQNEYLQSQLGIWRGICSALFLTIILLLLLWGFL